MKEIESFLRDLQLRNFSPHTLRGYRATLTEFARSAPGPVTSVGTQDIERYLSVLHERGISKVTKARSLAALKSWFRWMHAEGIIEHDIASVFDAPRRSQKIPPTPTVEEMKRILDGPISTPFPERDRLILELLYGSGLRVDEVSQIDVQDIQGDLLLVHGKGMKERQVPISDYAKDALIDYLPLRASMLGGKRAKTDALFFGLAGLRVQRLATRSMGRMVKQVGTAAGLPWLHPHSLRRAFASHMDQGGAPHFIISRLLGHAKLSTTEHYIASSSPARMFLAYDKACAT